MPDYLGAVGLLFFMFFLVAAATEAILETFRGLLERGGLTWFKADKSLDDAIKISTEFLPEGSEARGKINAIKEVVDNVKAIAAETRTKATNLKTEVDGIAAGTAVSDDLVLKINSLGAQIRDVMINSERKRVFWLRIISIAIAIILSYQADIDALRTMIQAYPALFDNMFGFYKSDDGWAKYHVGFIMTGIAAASGSSYWHDQLDKIRNLKYLQDRAKNITSNV